MAVHPQTRMVKRFFYFENSSKRGSQIRFKARLEVLECLQYPEKSHTTLAGMLTSWSTRRKCSKLQYIAVNCSVFDLMRGTEVAIFLSLKLADR